MPSTEPHEHPSRREFLAALTAVPLAATATQLAATAGVAAEPAGQGAKARRGIPLGFDNFAVRAMEWNVRQLVDHAEKLRCDSLFVTDFGPFEGRLDEASLGEVRRYAADKGVTIAVGTWSICPSAKRFRRDWGSAEEHLALGIRVAKALGAPAVRVILGSQEDRLSEGGIAARIADTVAVLKSQRQRALDSGVKVAVENHAGDMRSAELLGLVREAGSEFVGVNFDSGNACWTLEDPVGALATLGPHVLTTSLRDTMLWDSDRGVTAQWTAMGDGCTDLPAFFDRFAAACPGVAVHIETISGFPREFALFERDFWRAFPEVRALDLAPFLALARRGRPIERFTPPEGADRRAAERRYQLADLEKSIRYCREHLGLGMRTA
ncbi:MAG: sugar phosphate isomerase/epimerase family protein [Planctomycetia bacterium]